MPQLAIAYITGDVAVAAFITEVATRRKNAFFTLENTTAQLHYRLDILAAIESYLLAHWESNALEGNAEEIAGLAQATLAYTLMDVEQQPDLIRVFQLLADRINANVQGAERKARYGKTLLGVNDLMAIEQWVNEHEAALLASEDPTTLLHVLWPLLASQLSHANLNKLVPVALRLELAGLWVSGMAYYRLVNHLTAQSAWLQMGTQRGTVKLETVIDITEGAFGFDSTLVVGAVLELSLLSGREDLEELTSSLQLLQKQLKYGLPSELAIAFYEQGFADRVLAQELALQFSDFSSQRYRLRDEIRGAAVEVGALL